MSYGADQDESVKRIAMMIDKILKALSLPIYPSSRQRHLSL